MKSHACLRHYLSAILAFVFILLWPLAVAAQDGTAGPANPPSPEIAVPIYTDRCAACHGPTGQGDGPDALRANLTVPDLTDPELLRETTPARWFDIISNGVPGEPMPPFGEASSNPLRQIDRWNLVYYLYTLGTPPELVAMGEALYEQSCTECHAADGTGTADAPGFTDLDVMATRSQSDLFDAVADPSIEGHELDMGEVEIWAITDYVRTFTYDYAPAQVAEAAVPTSVEPFSGGEGVVSGRVINGTEEAIVPEGIELRLRAFDMNAAFIDAMTTTVGTDGSFRFEGIDVATPVQLEPLAIYQGIPYLGNLESAITLSPAEPEANTDITVYETTTDDSAIRIERLHIVFDVVPGQAQVAELYILSNTGDRTFVGTPEEGTLQIPVPSEALDVQPAGDPARYLALADGIADTTPIRPGVSSAESVIVYDLPYDGDLELSRPMPYPTDRINIFVPETGLELSGEGVQAGELFQAQNTTMRTYLAGELDTGQRLVMRLSGQPSMTGPAANAAQPSASPQPSQTQGIIIGAVTLAAALALAYLYWQGYLALTPATPDSNTALLQSIADLDDAFESGQIKTDRYQTQRAKLKEKLLNQLQ